MKGKMGSFVILVLVAAIMGLFALNVYQGYKYERLQAEVNEYQNTQEQWFEKNKQELTSLSAYSSPQHVKEVKENMKLTPISEMTKIKSSSITRFNTDGPRMRPARRAPTTCGILTLPEAKPRTFVERRIIAKISMIISS